MPHKEDLSHPVGQNILVNNGTLGLVMELVVREVDFKLQV